MSRVEILETPRLVLRHLTLGDLESMADIWTDAQVMRYMGGPRDRDRLMESMREIAQDEERFDKLDLWPLVEKASGTVIGLAGFLEKEVAGRDETELVYVLAASAWGQGYATEIAQALKSHAFTTLNLHRLIALIHPENTASERVAIKLGMANEGEVVRPGGNLRRVYAVARLE